MKIRSYTLLFRIFSFLADKTNGASLFVKYKLVLGTLIIGLTSVSCGKSKPQQPANPEPVASEPDISQITCYDPVVPQEEEKDTIKKVIPPIIDVQEVPMITCYDVSIDPMPEDTMQVVVMCYVQILDEPDIPEIHQSQPVMLYGSVQHPPASPVGDLEKFAKWVQDNIEYPHIMLEEKIQGRTTVNFIINADGKITETKVIQSISPDVDKEVLRVINSSPDWTPGWHQGKKVNTSVIIPIRFILPEE